MKINPSQPNNESEARKDHKPNWQSERRRRAASGETDAAVKYRLHESPLTEETKFVSILESAAKPQKLKQAGEDSSREQSDDDQKNEKQTARENDSTDSAAIGDRIERHNSSSGGFSGSSGFGESSVDQTFNLSENFAARSILHIADLERMISTIRTQIRTGGKREIHLELKRSVLQNLKVKITTDAARRVQIEFLAANEKIRSQIENHSEELADLLRGRGINLQSLRTTLDSNGQNDLFLPSDETKVSADAKEKVNENEPDISFDDNTFEESEASAFRV